METTEPIGIDVQPVTSWLESNIAGSVSPFAFSLITGGHSNLTYRVTDANGADYVLRRPPLGMVLSTAHDMNREFRAISAAGKTSVPVPKALAICNDESVNGAPFYVMNHVEGVVIHDVETLDTAIPSHDTRKTIGYSLVSALAHLHTADPVAIGLGDLGRTEDYIGRQLKRWSTQWENSRTRDLPDMDTAFQMLLDAKPPQRYSGIVHGDFRLGNCLVNPSTGQVAAILDWELCTLGDVMADVGYLLNNWVEVGETPARGATEFPTSAGGFITRDELVGAYSELTGFPVENIQYYQAFQHWRMGAIVEGVLARYLKGVMADDTVDTDSYRVQVDEIAAEAVRLMRTLG